MNNRGPNPFKIVTGVALLIAAVVLLFAAGSIVENLDSKEVMVIQYPSGTLKCATSPGYYMQWLGTATHYDRQDTLSFEAGNAIPVQFGDGAHGKIEGSLSWQMPVSCDQLIALHRATGSQLAVESRFLEPVVRKSVYFAGPLMTSKESYSERKGELLADIEDQIANGVYQTQTVSAKEPDPITGELKTVAHTVRVQQGGRFLRQDESPLKEFGIRTYNLAIKRVEYDKAVEDQIQEQQKLAMSVQTAVATSKQAEQRALTVAKEGEAKAAEAKWKQEVIKAEVVTAAEARFAVAQKNNETAEQDRQALLKKADGEATYRKRLMEADNALDARLRAQVEISKAFAEAIKQHAGPWVPSVVMGQTSGGNGATDLINLLTIQAAKQAGLTHTDKP